MLTCSVEMQGEYWNEVDTLDRKGKKGRMRGWMSKCVEPTMSPVVSRCDWGLFHCLECQRRLTRYAWWAVYQVYKLIVRMRLTLCIWYGLYMCTLGVVHLVSCPAYTSQWKMVWWTKSTWDHFCVHSFLLYRCKIMHLWFKKHVWGPSLNTVNVNL